MTIGGDSAGRRFVLSPRFQPVQSRGRSGTPGGCGKMLWDPDELRRSLVGRGSAPIGNGRDAGAQNTHRARPFPSSVDALVRGCGRIVKNDRAPLLICGRPQSVPPRDALPRPPPGSCRTDHAGNNSHGPFPQRVPPELPGVANEVPLVVVVPPLSTPPSRLMPMRCISRSALRDVARPGRSR